MKLKLESKDEFTLLTVTESVSAQDAQVIKAGILKLIQSGKQTLLIDLSQTPHSYPGLKSELVALQPKVNALDALLHIHEKGSVQETLKKFKTELPLLQATEARLSARFKKQTEKKTALQAKLQALGAENDIREIRLQNSQMRHTLSILEAQLREWAPKFIVREQDIDSIRETLHIAHAVSAVLAKQGVVKNAGP